MGNGGGELPGGQQLLGKPHVVITEQPASKTRYRYECEGRTGGIILGVSSTLDNKTFPTIKVVGFQGRATVIVSCVTKDEPYRPHPHNLVGAEGCKYGICILEIPRDTMTVQFSNLGLQCMRRKDVKEALKVRQEKRVDPFRTGFAHRNQLNTIDLSSVRLCFQVFVEDTTTRKFTKPLTPVVSDPIFDKKVKSELRICKLSACTAPVDGGKTDLMLLCEKVAKDDIQVRFYEENSNWQAYADVQPTQVHKQFAIWFKTPKYKTVHIQEPVKVFIQLKRPSDGDVSEPVPFEFLPVDSEPAALKHKRKKLENPEQILKLLQQFDTMGQLAAGFSMDTMEVADANPSYHGNIPSYHRNISPHLVRTQYGPSLSPSPSYMMANQNLPKLPTAVKDPTSNSLYGNNSQQPWNNTMLPRFPDLNNLAKPNNQFNAMSGTSTTITNTNIEENILKDLDTTQLNSDEIRDLLPEELPEISGDNLFSSSDDVQEDTNMNESIEMLANFRIDK